MAMMILLGILNNAVAAMTEEQGWQPSQESEWTPSIITQQPVRDDWLQDESVWGPTLIPIQDDDWSVTVRVALGHPGGWRCDCWNTTEDGRHLETECRCTGLTLQDVPHTLIKPLHSLTVSITGLRVLRKDGLQPYKDTLIDVTLTELRYLKKIEKGTFRNLKHLRTIYISEAPALKFLPPRIFDGLPPTFRTLRIMHTGLEMIPDMAGMGRRNIVHMIDLESNKFKEVKTNSINVKTEQLLLNYNNIEVVSGWAFNGSEISKLSLKGNRGLRILAQDAFYGLKILNDLDLSQTAITYLPTGGLEDLDTLRIKDTDSLKVIPSVYSFKHLKEAWLTYSFHCCAFKFPARHNPSRHALHQAYLAKIEEYCNGQEYDDTGQRHSQGQQRVNRHRRGGKQRQQVSEGITALYTPFLTPTSDQWDPFLKEESQSFGPLSGQEWDKAKEENWLEVAGSDESRERNPEDGGVFHQTTATLTATKLHALCGNLSVSSTSVHCRPEPNPFNPCEDIMGYTWLRVSVWFVVVTACFGNLAVLLVLLSRMMDVSVPKFLMCHLAFADLCMGVYLLILASMDLHSSTVYFNYAYDWQIGTGCQVAGFITVFASQLSIFTLTILTLERWFAITYAIYLNKRLKLCTAAQIMAGGWTYSLVMAALPLFGISSYSTTSICLPLEVRDVTDISYLVCLLLINSLAFLVIAVCYIQIYHSLGQETRRPSHSTKGEMTVAKKMALLVLTDFACWAPIAFFSGTALAGYPLIDVTRSKILLVFFYPLNSCANPYLYAILTAQYRRDLFILLARYGVCTKVAQQYKITYSLPTTNNSNPIPLITRGVDITTTTTNLIEETRLNDTRLVPSVANDMGATNHLVNEITTTTNEEVFV